MALASPGPPPAPDRHASPRLAAVTVVPLFVRRSPTPGLAPAAPAPPGPPPPGGPRHGSPGLGAGCRPVGRLVDAPSVRVVNHRPAVSTPLAPLRPAPPTSTVLGRQPGRTVIIKRHVTFRSSPPAANVPRRVLPVTAIRCTPRSTPAPTSPPQPQPLAPPSTADGATALPSPPEAPVAPAGGEAEESPAPPTPAAANTEAEAEADTPTGSRRASEASQSRGSSRQSSLLSDTSLELSISVASSKFYSPKAKSAPRVDPQPAAAAPPPLPSVASLVSSMGFLSPVRGLTDVLHTYDLQEPEGRPELPAAGLGEVLPAEPTAASPAPAWGCLDCFFDNDPTAAACALCGAPRPAPQESPATWTCSRCGLANPVKLRDCRSCMTTKGGLDIFRKFSIISVTSEWMDSSLDGEGFNLGSDGSPAGVMSPASPPRAPVWTCPHCFHDNPSAVELCAGCGSEYNEGWNCQQCGLLNERKAFNCISCDAHRPRLSRKTTSVRFDLNPTVDSRAE